MIPPFLLHLCVLFFGMSSWLSINTIYVQLPILSPIVPESWNFATYIVVIIQISCVFPLLYSLIRVRWPNMTSRVEAPLVILLLLVDIFGLLLTTLTYQSRTFIVGQEHSLWLLVSLLILCIPCTMADVLFLPLIGRLSSSSSQLVTTFYIGMGLGAFVPSGLSFVQGSPKVDVIRTNSSSPSYIIHANFSYKVFVYIICVFVLISLAAYIFLIFHSRQSRKCHSMDKCSIQQESSSEESSILWPIVISLIAGSFQNSLLPSFINYSSVPYSSETYHLSTTLFVMTNPLFCLLQHLYSFSSSPQLAFLSLLASIPSLYIIVLACLPSALPFTAASTLLLMSSALSAGLLSLLRTSSAARLASHSNKQALFLCGAATQMGSFIGAITVFILANLFHVFPSS